MSATTPGDAARRPLEVPRRFDGLRGLLGIHPCLLLIAPVGVLYPLIASEYWTFNVAAGVVLAISCLGLLVVVGWLGEISLMQAGLTGASVYITAALSVDTFGEGEALRFPVAAACGIAFAVVLSVLVGSVGMRLPDVYLIVLTFAAQVLVEHTAFTSETFSPGMADWSYPRPNLFNVHLRTDTRFYYVILGVLAVVTVFLHRLRRSRFGRAMILVGSDPEAAAAAGVSPWRYRVGAFALAGVCAGVAGALSAPLYYGPPGSLAYISFNSLFYLAIDPRRLRVADRRDRHRGGVHADPATPAGLADQRVHRRRRGPGRRSVPRPPGRERPLHRPVRPPAAGVAASDR